MEEKHKTSYIVSTEKFSKIIGKLNKIYDNKNTDPNFEKKEDKYKNYIFQYVENLVKQETKVVVNSILTLFNLKREFIEKTGDELVEKIWKLYDIKTFEKGIICIDKNNHLLNMINIFLFFNHYKQFDSLYEIDEENMKIKQKVTLSKELLENTGFEYKSLSEKKNTLIDLFILYIFSIVELKNFYTSISTFILSTDSNVILLFKTIALFGLSIAQIKKKEDFLASVYFIIGGVLRTHARSYLKTKGNLNENLSDVQCKKHKNGEHQHLEPKILTTLECDFLEQYFFLIMNEFIYITTKPLNFETKWDSFSFVFLKNLEIGEMDCEDQLPPEVSILHYTILFLSDFAFSFITNFVNYEKSDTYLTKFDHFQDFIDLFISILSLSCHNILNLFFVSDRKKKIQEIDCEKTEYEIKDAFNHYGICLIFYYILKGNYILKSVKNREKINSSPIPCVTNKESISTLIISMIYMFIFSENNSNFSSFEKMRPVFKELILMLLDNYITNSNDLVRESTIFENILLEYLNLDCSDDDFEYINKISTVLKGNNKRLLQVIVDSSKSKKQICKTLSNLNLLIFKHPESIRMDYIDLSNVLTKLTLNGMILDENLNKEISRFYNTFKFEGIKEEFHKKVNQFIGQINNYENESNYNDEEKALLKNNQNQLVSLLYLFIN